MAKEKKEELEIVNITPTEIAPSDLRSMMEVESERRVLVKEFIAHHMVKDVDYGTISIGGRASKPSLFKPGSEKFLSLFKLTATFKKDGETWEMAGSIAGLFTYICEIKTSKGVVVGEGRGAANLAEKSNWTVNNAVKIAQKRAQVDAVLRMGALSDFFTQDLEDMAVATPVAPKTHTLVRTIFPEEREERAPTPVADTHPWRTPKAPSLMSKDEQRVRIKVLCDGITLHSLDTKEEFEAWVQEQTGINLVSANFPAIIKALEKMKETKGQVDEADQELEGLLNFPE